MTEGHFYIGISKRTNEEGAYQLAEHLADFGYSATLVPVAEGLHLKSGASYVGKGRMVLAKAFGNQPEFLTFDRIVTTGEESYAANCIMVNGTLIISDGYPHLKRQLNDHDITFHALDMSEFRKMDGSLTLPFALIFLNWTP